MNPVVALLTTMMLTGTMAQAAAPANTVDQQLMSACAARTDARMESMTLGKLDQIRNYEFSLRIAIAQLAAGSGAMTPKEWQLATAKLSSARNQLAQVCGVMVPTQS